MTGTPVARSTSAFHSVTTANLPPTRKDSTIASFSEATSWPSSTVPLPDVLSRKNRAVDDSAALVPRRRRETDPFLPAVAFRFRDAARCRSCRPCCHRIAPWPKLAACPPRRPQAASRHLSDARLPDQRWHASISAVPEKAILRKTALAEPITGSPAELTPARDRYLFRPPSALLCTRRRGGHSAPAPFGGLESNAPDTCRRSGL